MMHDTTAIRTGTKSAAAAVAALLFIPLVGAAQVTTISGQIRPRLEARDPSGTATEEFISMRTRVGLGVQLETAISFFLQVQDVRYWGEESSPLSDYSADGLDAHQAYVQVDALGGTELAVRIGRQELVLGGERLVGAVGWAQQGQSFDGVLVTLDPFGGIADAFAFRVAEEAGGRPRDEWLVGGYATVPVGDSEGDGVDIYGILHRVRVNEDTDEATAGMRWFATRGNLDARAEVSLQIGERDGVDMTAFMIGLRGGLRFAEGRAKATLWYDYLSGDDDIGDDKVRAFHTLFATNHKFYGFADLFTNIPVATGQRGLQDAALKLSFAASPRTDLGLDIHSFSVTKQRNLSSSHLAEELDFSLVYRYRPGLTFSGGYSVVLQDDPLAEIGLPGRDENISWAYAMLSAVF